MNNEKFTASDVAHIIINEARKRHVGDLTSLKLQKLLYFAYGWYSVFHEEPLFDDKFIAYYYGPVIDRINHSLRANGQMPIVDEDNWLETRFKQPSEKVPEKVQELIDFIADHYFKYTASELVRITHKENSPWHKAYNDRKGVYSVISTEDIKEHFDCLYKQTKKGK